MRQRIAAVTAAAALAIAGNVAISGNVASAGGAQAGVASAGAAQAVAPCRVTGYTPNTVVVGLSPVTRTFNVRSSNCLIWHWSLSLPPSLIIGDASDSLPSLTFDPSTKRCLSRVPSFGCTSWSTSYGLMNSDAGAHRAVAGLSGSSTSGFGRGTRSWANGFHLKRANGWGSTFNAGPEPVKKGRAITLQGKLSMVNWNTHGLSYDNWVKSRYLGHGSQSVKVQFRTPTGSYATVKTIKTNSSGWARTKVTARRTGVWRLVYSGNSVSGPATALGDLVKVN